jgi:alanine racemase
MNLLKTKRSWLEISQSAFNYNIQQLSSLLGSTELAVVVKSNAYGHGMHEIAQLSEQLPEISWLCTAGLQEALDLKIKSKTTKKVLALSYLDADYEAAALYEIHCGIYDYETVYHLNRAAQKVGKPLAIHIKVDTGMSRLGIACDQVVEFIQKISSLPYIKLYGVFTHLCDTANSDTTFSMLQLMRFNTVLDELKAAGIDLPAIHALSSSGLSVMAPRNYSILRAGALAYGIWKSAEHQQLVTALYPQLNLKPVISWKTSIAQIKHIPEGSYIGYNCTFKTTRKSIIALLPVGYWDGYPRNISNKGFVEIKGQKAPVVGIVSMNLTAIDITDIPGVSLQDTVTLVGSKNIPLCQVAEYAGTIPNEITTRICSSLQRIITERTELPASTSQTLQVPYTENIL